MIKWRDKDIEKLNHLRSYLMNNRPKYRKNLVEEVWAAAKDKDDKVFDPYNKEVELTWNKSESRYRQWHMGHRRKHKYSNLVDEYIGHRNYDKFLEDYNNPKYYHPQDPKSNMSHENE